MKKYSRNKLLQTFAYIMLLLVMLTSVGAIAVKIVLKSSENADKTRELEKARIALSYVNMMIRQNAGEGNVRPFGEGGILIENYAGVEDLNCAVYFKEGCLYEATYSGDFSEDYAEKIVELNHMDIAVLAQGVRVRLELYGGVMERFIAFRSLSLEKGGYSL